MKGFGRGSKDLGCPTGNLKLVFEFVYFLGIQTYVVTNCVLCEFHLIHTICKHFTTSKLVAFYYYQNRITFTFGVSFILIAFFLIRNCVKNRSQTK